MIRALGLKVAKSCTTDEFWRPIYPGVASKGAHMASEGRSKTNVILLENTNYNQSS